MNFYTKTKEWLRGVAGIHTTEFFVGAVATVLAFGATIYFFMHGLTLAYGDAESHLNIAKRVVDSLTPGLAQLGGIWLPLPHIFLIPFVYFNSLYRTGLAGSIVSGVCFVISSVFIYKLSYVVTKHKPASLFAAAIFMLNPNILYLQATPMTELVLLVFFILSTYYFVLFLYGTRRTVSFVAAAFFGFCATLSRYDGWGLVLMEAAIVFLFYLPYKFDWKKASGKFMEKFGSWRTLEGRVIMFATLAFFGILLWLGWCGLILGDPLYFAHSQFSASSQQNSWLLRGELPAYHHILVAIQYYAVTAAQNMGLITTVVAVIGLIFFLVDRKSKARFFTFLLLAVPFIFNVATLYLGQSVIFIPALTPISWGWQIFNVRYGVMMIPFFAFCGGFIFYKVSETKWRLPAGALIVTLFVAQTILFSSGAADAITIQDGREGLSSDISNVSAAEIWFDHNYDGGLVLLDDFSRPISIARSPVDMRNIIYIGNKPYWDDSLVAPEKYATWIIMSQNDAVWQGIWNNPTVKARLFKYFNKVYTSDQILIFKRISNGTAQ